jgi:hypothetical protein
VLHCQGRTAAIRWAISITSCLLLARAALRHLIEASGQQVGSHLQHRDPVALLRRRPHVVALGVPAPAEIDKRSFHVDPKPTPRQQ